MIRPAHLRSLLAALLVVILGTPALAAACVPVQAERPHCPLMAAGACPSPPAGHHGHGGEVERRAMDCCAGPSSPADSAAATSSAPTLLSAGEVLPVSPAPSPRAESHPVSRAAARSSPRALYTLFRSLLI